MEDLLKLLIEPLVSDIDKVKIEKSGDSSNVVFTVHVPKEDIAKVIGKEGKMIKSIKNLLKIRAIKENVFATLEVQEV
ncbi:MAG: KH domain-containing protein [Candidatus Curtissbacteria bacterium]|nr:KH domain-containing protein [Candidatus Curtissbacteria bacterium]